MTEPWWTLARWGLAAVFGLVAMIVGDPAVRRVFRLAGDSGPVTDTPPVVDQPSPAPTETLLEAAGERLRGGRAIGVLERLGIYATLLSAFPAGIAVIVAVKGLARYPDLKASDGTAERFIVGTLASLLVATAAAGVAHWLIGLVPGPGG